MQDRDGAKRVFEAIKRILPSMKIIFADGGYAGELIVWVEQLRSFILKAVKRTDKGFKILPKRWIVERTFAWLYKYRRLSRDYERYATSGEDMIRLAMINIMLRRLG
jgi:putative transposase